MKPIICISLKRLAVSRMQQVKSGALTIDEGIEAIQKARISKEQIIEQLTREFDPEYLKALRFFRLL